MTVYLKVSLRGCFSSRKGIVDGSQNHSTVTDFPFPTKLNNLIPFITFIYRFNINKKGEMIEEKYSDFGIGFYEVT